MACENKNVNKIVELLDSKSAEDIVVLDVKTLTTICDYFIIATGKNDRLVKALADKLEDETAKDNIYPVNKDGYKSGDWILTAFDDIIVHIFKPETRQFFDLERVWKDAVVVDISDLIK